MPRPCVEPIGVVPCERHTTKNPPGNHSQLLVTVILPPAPMGPGLKSPVDVQRPTKYSSFFTSGPGWGACEGACALSSAGAKTRTIAALFIGVSPRDDGRKLLRPP